MFMLCIFDIFWIVKKNWMFCEMLVRIQIGITYVCHYQIRYLNKYQLPTTMPYLGDVSLFITVFVSFIPNKRIFVFINLFFLNLIKQSIALTFTTLYVFTLIFIQLKSVFGWLFVTSFRNY